MFKFPKFLIKILSIIDPKLDIFQWFTYLYFNDKYN